jgi:hypothetical protein
MMTIQELLFSRGLDKSAPIKLIRHRDPKRCDLEDKYWRNREWFLAYQSSQAKPIFRACKYIVSFIGEEGSLARFVGVYQIIGEHENIHYDPDSLTNNKYRYEMEEIDGFNDLKEQVVIKWNNPISWHQWIKNEMAIVSNNSEK